MPDLWIPASVGQDLLAKSKKGGEEGFLYTQALESVLREYGVGTAELELAQDEAGWMKLGVSESGGLLEWDRIYAVRRARVYHARDPL